MAQFDFDDELEFDENDNTPLVKQLRKQIKELASALKERDEMIEELQYVSRETTIQDILEEYGLDPRVARFIPDDVDADEDSVVDWLREYGDVFGIVEVDDESEDHSDYRTAAEQMSAVEAGGIDPTIGQDLEARISQAASPEELLNLLRG